MFDLLLFCAYVTPYLIAEDTSLYILSPRLGPSLTTTAYPFPAPFKNGIIVVRASFESSSISKIIHYMRLFAEYSLRDRVLEGLDGSIASTPTSLVVVRTPAAVVDIRCERTCGYRRNRSANTCVP